MKYKSLIYQIILDILFYLSFFSFLHYSRNKIYYYMNLIRSYSPDLLQLQETLINSNQIENLADTQLLLNQINSIVNKSMLFGYLVMPIVFFVIIVIFWSWIYGIIKNENLKDYRYYLRFGIITLPFYLLFILSFKNILEMINLIPLYGGMGVIQFYHFIYLIIPLIVYYFLQIIYSQKGNMKEVYNKFVKTIKKVELIPLIVIQGLLQFLVFVFASLNYIAYLVKEINYNVLVLFFLLLLFNCYRNWLIRRIENYSKN